MQTLQLVAPPPSKRNAWRTAPPSQHVPKPCCSCQILLQMQSKTPTKLALHGEADHAHLLCGSSCSTSALWTSVVVIPQDHEGMYVLEEVIYL
mmetsp:Transcript_240/g.364  ORF Transcript_240/g.364 Transcript_240/m.364 type:complete len:93 (-) Transcript_240:76-354(-)